MPGHKPKAHHFIQEKYLEGFCDPVPHETTRSPVLWVHSADKPPRRQVPRECAVENYFYCHEDKNGQRSWLVETFLADLETASSAVLKDAQAGILPKTVTDRFTLTGYAAMSLVRTPTAKRLMDQAAIDDTVRKIRDLVNDPVRYADYCNEMESVTGERWDPEVSKRKLTGGNVRAVQTNRAWSLRTMAEMMMFFQKQFMKMHLVMLHANDAFFLTSDCPLAVHNPATRPNLPKRFRSFDMRFPVSREYCLAGSFTFGPSHLELERDQVQNMNRMLIRQADRFVYAPFNADYVQPELMNSLAEKTASKPDDIVRFF